VTDADGVSELIALLNTYIASDPRLEIWRHYPDITEGQNDYTDTWACEQVSAEFATFARSLGWDAAAVRGENPDHPFAFDHAWVRLTRDGRTTDIDWTARQYHNLHEADGHDPAVLNLPWPLVWDPAVVGPDAHLIVGSFASARPAPAKTKDTP